MAKGRTSRPKSGSKEAEKLSTLDVRRLLPSTRPWPVAMMLNVGIGTQAGSVEVVGVVVVVVAIVEWVMTEDTDVSIEDWVKVEDANVSTDEEAEPTEMVDSIDVPNSTDEAEDVSIDAAEVTADGCRPRS
ncbi:hypothetical protein FALCPG4_004175 [Fusarium falciforme]